MSLDSLASRSAVSRSMISLVERGESSPTAVVLEKIAAGLGLPLGKLFDDPSAHADPISRGADRAPWRDPQSGYVRRNVSPPNFPSPIQLVEVVMPAGASVAYENAAQGVRIHQQIWVTEGTIEVTVGEEPHPAFQGRLLRHGAKRADGIPESDPAAGALCRRCRNRTRARFKEMRPDGVQIRCLDRIDRRELNDLCDVLIDSWKGAPR